VTYLHPHTLEGAMNRLYYGDNLAILREQIPDASVDLIYLDPPFNSNRSYNVLFREASGKSADAQITAFDDTWHWGPAAEETLREIETTAPQHVVEMMQAIVGFVGRNDVSAYLVMMTVRLIQLHRVLKPSGSLYLHCDPTASHYLKVVLDTVFGKERFVNEIIWQRTNAKGLAFTRFASNHDVIFRYARSDSWVWNPQYTPHDPKYVQQFYRYVDPDTGRRYRLADLTNPNKDRPNLTYEFLGVTRVWRWTRERMQAAYDAGLIVQTKPGAVPALKRYLDEQEGTPVGDTWPDIRPVQSQASEALGYPTQKPLALLERIIQASSNPGDLVLDPFCGCGTTVCAAQKLGRRWMGIDITHLAIALMRTRLDDMFGSGVEYEVVGQPADLASAEALARADRYQFQMWALSLIKARPWQSKKGADQGADGVLYFVDEARQPAKKAVIQVKSGGVGSAVIRDLGHVVEREKAALGFLITLEQPTRPMEIEALSAGYYHSPGWNRDYARLQIRTIAQLLAGWMFDYPQSNVTLSRAEREHEQGEQGKLM
jgi:site-specific DNA-methyltransferase (adenine-specific)